MRSDAFYGFGQRYLQTVEGSTPIADRLLETRCRNVFSAQDVEFITSAPFLFLATADSRARPDCSYKGGAPGFVKVVGPNELVFPNFDGNGMFRSLGNLLENASVGLLFVKFDGERKRLRVNGTASFVHDDPMLVEFPGATHVVHVTARDVFPNCPRYVHEMTFVAQSEYVPRVGCEPPQPAWKSKPDLRDYLPLGRTRTTPPYDTHAGQCFLREHYALLMGDPADLASKDHGAAVEDTARRIEEAWIAEEETLVANARLPQSAAEFEGWYRAQVQGFQSMTAPLVEHLRERSTLEDLALYISMEEAVDGSFDDVIALAQVGVPPHAKMAMARNYWDEMGNGDLHLVHTHTFANSVRHLKQFLPNSRANGPAIPPIECLMNGNLLLMWALRRRFAIRLYGAIGLVEGTASSRFEAVTHALGRHGVPVEAVAYHRQHIQMDARHGDEWLECVMEPYARRGGSVLRELCLGVLIRARVALRYYERIAEEFSAS